MASQLGLTPVTKTLQSIKDQDVHSTDPMFNGGSTVWHNYGPDHGSVKPNVLADSTIRQTHGLELGTVKPGLALAAPAIGRGSGHVLTKTGHDRHFSSDDGTLSRQIIATHTGDYDDLDVRPLLAIVEDVMRLARPLTTEITALGNPIQPKIDHIVDDKIYKSPVLDNKVYHNSLLDDNNYHSTKMEDKLYSSHYHDADVVQVFAMAINKICSEIICKCASGAEAHSVTIEFLRQLSSYSWDAKAVITLAAFAINYGEFWLIEQHRTTNALAKNIATLKAFPETTEQITELRKKIEAVVNLLQTLLKATYCIIEFKELPSQYISRDSPEMVAVTAHIPTTAYWIIRSLLACESVLLNLNGGSQQFLASTSESWEILSMNHKVTVMMEHLRTQLNTCWDSINRKKGEDAYITFKKLMEGVHMDNMKVLRAMIRYRDDQRPLFSGSTNMTERLEVLRMKHVLLLISDLNPPQEELNILHLIYNQHNLRQDYDVLWLPIIDQTVAIDKAREPEFRSLQKSMPWHSVDDMLYIEPVAIRYIREVWNFRGKPMLVVLDPQGKPSNLDALPMMWIWGSAGFPFTKVKERSLWADSTWNITLLADAIDPRLSDWIRDNRVICLYGGEDLEWIRRFTAAAKGIAKQLNVPLEMLYVGKANPKEKVRRCNEIIHRENLSHVFSPTEYYDYMWYFWIRLLSMWNSKKQMGMSHENDTIMHEILNMLTFDSSELGWAVFSRGNNEIAQGKGDILLPVFEKHQDWSYNVDHPEKFVQVLDDRLRDTHPEHHCNRLILPGHAGHIPEQVVCSECGRVMDKYVMYRCCTD